MAKKINKKILEEELGKAIETFDFKKKIGKEIKLSMNDGHLYVGTLLGIDGNHLYLKEAYLPDTTMGLKSYVEIWIENISAQLYNKEI